MTEATVSTTKSATGFLEYTEGQEQHSSNWGKYYVKWQGMENHRVKEDGSYDKHHTYTEYCAHIPIGTILTIFEQSGNKRGTETFYFSIWEVTDVDHMGSDEAEYGRGKAVGNIRKLGGAYTPTKAPRLMEWWTKKPAGTDPKAWAEHCLKWIEKRGIKEIPTM